MKMRLLFIFALVCLVSVPAMAETMSFQEMVAPTSAYQHDMVIIHGTSGSNEGGASLLLGDKNDGVNLPYRALFGYDISDIPAGATIDSVTLSVYGKGPDTSSVNEDATINLYELVGTFEEASVNWVERDNTVPTNWTTAGGDYNSTVLSSISDNPRTITTGEEVTLANSTAFVDAAQAALDGSGSLYMLMRIAEEGATDGSRHIFQFYTDDYSTSYNPKLTITYTATEVPEPSTIVLLLTALLAAGFAVKKNRQ